MVLDKVPQVREMLELALQDVWIWIQLVDLLMGEVAIVIF